MCSVIAVYHHNFTDSLAVAEGAAAAALLRSKRKDKPQHQGSTDSLSAALVQALAADHRRFSESLAAAEAAAAARADEASASAQRAAAAEAAAGDARAQLDQAHIQLQARDPPHSVVQNSLPKNLRLQGLKTWSFNSWVECSSWWHIYFLTQNVKAWWPSYFFMPACKVSEVALHLGTSACSLRWRRKVFYEMIPLEACMPRAGV